MLVTQDCNLRCSYCYIAKHPRVMKLDTAVKIVDFGFQHTPASEWIEFGLFGGEPFLELDLLKQIADLVVGHPSYTPERVVLNLTTNGTLLTQEALRFVTEYGIHLVVSCDGVPDVHDANRRFADGRPTSTQVETAIRSALAVRPQLPVNAVYGPDTLEYLPDTLDYLGGLGVRVVHLNANITAAWTERHGSLVEGVYAAVAKRYAQRYIDGDPAFISLIDIPVAVILRGGYGPLERCRMAAGEFAFSPEGYVYPCERLVGDGGPKHRVGHVDSGIAVPAELTALVKDHVAPTECAACGVRGYCMHWCACTNYLATGSYGRPSPFQCASERAALRAAFDTARLLQERLGPDFCDHASGLPKANSLRRLPIAERRCHTAPQS